MLFLPLWSKLKISPFLNIRIFYRFDFLRIHNLCQLATSSSQIHQLKASLFLQKSQKSWCQKLKSIEFLQKFHLKKLSRYAFSKKSIQNVSIPSLVTHVHSFAFTSCKQRKSVQFSFDSKLNSNSSSQKFLFLQNVRKTARMLLLAVIGKF